MSSPTISSKFVVRGRLTKPTAVQEIPKIIRKKNATEDCAPLKTDEVKKSSTRSQAPSHCYWVGVCKAL
jgi:hypothetical protein